MSIKEQLQKLNLELNQLLWDKPRGKVPEWMITEVLNEIKLLEAKNEKN